MQAASRTLAGSITLPSDDLRKGMYHIVAVLVGVASLYGAYGLLKEAKAFEEGRQEADEEPDKRLT
jgi:hypothetical protein